MKEKATMFDYARMCKHFDDNCQECPIFYKQTETGLSCEKFIRNCPDTANETILNWCKEHPVETRQDRFLKLFPNAEGGNGVIKVWPNEIDRESGSNCGKQSCDVCRRNYWFEEVKENESRFA